MVESTVKFRPLMALHPLHNHLLTVLFFILFPTAILLGHLKLPADDILKAVLTLDDSKLSEPHIRTLLMCAPENPEVR